MRVGVVWEQRERKLRSFRCRAGLNIGDFASKLGGTAIIKGGNVALAKSRDDDSDEEPIQEPVEEPVDDASDSIYSVTDSFTDWLTGGGNE